MHVLLVGCHKKTSKIWAREGPENTLKNKNSSALCKLDLEIQNG
jgi:hypothetical protein